MIKKYIYPWIILIVILSSILGIYRQLNLLLNAQKQIYSLDQKITKLEQRNRYLKKSINP